MPPAWKRLIESLGIERRILDPQSGLRHRAYWRLEHSRENRWLFRLKPSSSKHVSGFPNWNLEILYTAEVDSIDWLKSLDALGTPGATPIANLDRRFNVIVTPNRWPTSILDAIVAEPHPAASQALIGLDECHPHFPTNDPWLQSIAPFLRWESPSVQFQRVSQHIGALRPLQRSIAANEVADLLQIPSDIVMVVFRNLAATDTLLLDKIEPYGWVLSEQYH